MDSNTLGTDDLWPKLLLSGDLKPQRKPAGLPLPKRVRISLLGIWRDPSLLLISAFGPLAGNPSTPQIGQGFSPI